MKHLLFAVALLFPLRGAYAGPIDFALSSATIATTCREAREESDRRLSALAALPARSRTFANTLVAFSDILADLDERITPGAFLGEVSPDAGVREAGNACDTATLQYLVEVHSREDLYAALKAYAAQQERLEGEDARLLERTLLEFKRGGLDLPAARRAEVQDLRKRIVTLQNEFRKALAEEKTLVSFTAAELAGLPEDMLKRLPREGELYQVSLDYPDYLPFMENVKDPAARARLEKHFNSRGGEANSKRLLEALRLRARAASLQGYRTHAHYVLEERMAKDPAAALDFLKRLKAKLDRKAKPEQETLLAMKKADLGAAYDGVLRAWDFRYYNNQLMKTRYQVDDEKIKEYFPVDTVVAGMLDVYQTLLDLRYTEVKPPGAWHPDVSLYRVDDGDTGRTIGFFYLDLYPREGKYKHAAAFLLARGRRLPDKTYRRPVSAMVANLAKPTADAPALLKHEEVKTLFHEFGHIMHQVLTQAKYPRFAGTVAWDFIEAPSKMLENWIWQPVILERLSGHYQDRSRKLPADLLEKMVAAKNVNSGLKYLRQNFLSMVDLLYHTTAVDDPTALYGKLQREITMVEMTPGTRPDASFGHTMGSYDAGYYGYLWAEVFAQDMFSRFEKAGPLDRAAGRDYRRFILEPGSSVDEAVSVRRFLGREPNEDAFLKDIGL